MIFPVGSLLFNPINAWLVTRFTDSVVFPVGSLLFNPINAWLVTRFTWRIAFRFSSILILGLGVACCWTFSSKDEPGHQQFQNEDGKDPFTLCESESKSENFLNTFPLKRELNLRINLAAK